MESTKLIDEVSNGNVDRVRALLCDQNLNLEQADENGLTPLLMASYKGHYEIAKLLIEHGSNVNYTGHHQKYTALMFAALGGHKKLVNLLLESGADHTLTNSINRTCAQLAAFTGQTEITMMINNFLPKSTIEYYTQSKNNSQAKLQKHLVNSLHKFVLTVNVHPIYIFMNLEHYADLIKSIDQVIKVLIAITDQEMTEKEIPAEHIAFKFSYLAYVLEYFERQFNLIRDKNSELDLKEQIQKTANLIIKMLLKERNKSGFPITLEKFIRTAIGTFKYKDSSVFVMILHKINKMNNEQGALQLLIDSINDQKGFFNSCTNCQTCNEVNPKSKCSQCKTIWYCNQNCQKYDWPGHKLICKKV